MEEKPSAHKPLLNGFYTMIILFFLIFLTAKNMYIGLITIILLAIIAMSYIREDDPNNYVAIKNK